METLVACSFCNIHELRLPLHSSAPPPPPCSCSSASASAAAAPSSSSPISADTLLATISHLHSQIASLPSLRPSDAVNTLFSHLVSLCLLPSDIAPESSADPSLQTMRHSLIRLCAAAEGLLERHYAELLAELPNPHLSFDRFPYYANYRKLAALEHTLLSSAAAATATSLSRIAFVGSGPMPLTSIVLASHHLPTTEFHNFDLDAAANSLAAALVASDADLAPRMAFHTRDILKQESLRDYDAVFLAALVGMDAEAKGAILAHLAATMRPGAYLVVRSAKGARAFLYPVVAPSALRLAGFHVLSVFHPSDEVVNSVIVAVLPSSFSSS